MPTDFNVYGVYGPMVAVIAGLALGFRYAVKWLDERGDNQRKMQKAEQDAKILEQNERIQRLETRINELEDGRTKALVLLGTAIGLCTEEHVKAILQQAVSAHHAQ